MQPVFLAVQDKSNNVLRKRTIEYLKIIIESHTIDNINFVLPSIESILPELLADAIPEVRSTSRTILSLIEQKFPEIGEKIIEASSSTLKKSLGRNNRGGGGGESPNNNKELKKEYISFQ